MKRILMLATGGTIASVESEMGFTPRMSGEQLAAQIPELSELCTIDCKTILSVDSANIQPEDWQLMAREIFSALTEYDGFVVTHGTNTMAYSAAALSVMLPDLDRPVILTGSQIPLGISGSDAHDNILHAFTAAVHGPAGVYIMFYGKLIRGLHASKQRSRGFDAFVSVNQPLAGELRAGKLCLSHADIRRDGRTPSLDDRIETRVFLCRLTPGLEPAVLKAMGMQCRGLVLEAFGVGGIPSQRRNLLPVIKELVDAGVVVAATTQCLFDGCDFQTYDIGREALDTGMLSAGDWPSEAVLVLLMTALGRGMSGSEIAQLLGSKHCPVDPDTPIFF